MMTANFKSGKMLGFFDISQTTSSKFTYGPISQSEKHEGWYTQDKLTINELADAGVPGHQTNIVVGYDDPGLLNGNKVYNMHFAASRVKK